jgi:hypothetical protein
VKEKFTENLDEGSDLSGERAFESHGAPQQTYNFRIRKRFEAAIPRFKAHRDSIFLYSTYPCICAMGFLSSRSLSVSARDDVNKTSPGCVSSVVKQGKIAATASTRPQRHCERQRSNRICSREAAASVTKQAATVAGTSRFYLR